MFRLIIGSNHASINPRVTCKRIDPSLMNLKREPMPDLNLSDQIAALPLTHYADLPAASREPILLVDDSSTDRLRLKQMLERLGYQVYTAVDGINGLELLDQYRIRLIVTDLNMPNMGGYGFCKRLKTEETIM